MPTSIRSWLTAAGIALLFIIALQLYFWIADRQGRIEDSDPDFMSTSYPSVPIC